MEPFLNENFPMEWETPDNHPESIKWSLGRAKHEIYHHTLARFELGHIVTHCLSVLHKVDKEVGDDDDDRFTSYKIVFPRTLSIPLLATWDQLCVDFPLLDEKPESFRSLIKHFIEAHATDDDRHELLDSIRHAHKPRFMKTQAFYYRLRELNEQVEYLPGEEDKLNLDQLDQAFHDGMPSVWRERYTNAGRSVRTDEHSALLKFFRDQQHASDRAAVRNARTQKDSSKKKASSSNSASFKSKDKLPVKKTKWDSKHKSKNPSTKDKKGPGRISDDTPCPIHPGSTHNWGECFQNVANKSKSMSTKKAKGKGKGKAKEDETDGHAMHVDSDASIASVIDDMHSLIIHCDDDEEVDSVELLRRQANAEIGHPEYPEDMLLVGTEINLKGEFIEHAFVAEEIFTHHHHLDDSSLLAMQETTESNLLSDEFMDVYVQYIDEQYSLGVDEDKHLAQSFDSKLRLRATSFAIVPTMQKTRVNCILKVLFDSGCDKTMLKLSSLPKGINPTLGRKRKITGVTSSSSTDKEVSLQDLNFPEFSTALRVPGPITVIVMPNDTPYDLIIGMDLMQPLGIDIHNSTKTVCWNDKRIPFKPYDYFTSGLYQSSLLEAMAESLDNADDDPLHQGYHSKDIYSSNYGKSDPRAVAEQQTHLTLSQRQDLANLLVQFPKLFSGKLGKYPGKLIHLDLKADVQPSHRRPYPVPRQHERVFKEELDRLCAIGVLSRCGASSWLSPSFIIPKKDARVRWISDFRELNKCIKRRVYNLPKIQDILLRRSGYTFFSKLDISMQYYTFELDDASKELCTICTPFGNYRYNRLPLGVSQSPDLSQEIMEDLFRQFNEVDVYIDDIGVFSPSWQSHCNSLQKILALLEQNNFIVNPAKCEWGVKETDWLGYWLTPTGLKPWKKKITAILAIKRPETVKQLRSFLGAVNYYRDMFPKRSHILAPLTALVGGKGKLTWTKECQQAFDAMKALLAKDAFLMYPDHNKPFHIYCDASDLQLGAAIIQDSKPVAFYSRKLNSAQRNYTVGEKELLSIVETLKTFRTMLYGCQHIHIYTDHKNNTFQNLQTQRVLRWRLFLEDFGVQFHYIKGETNSLADALSRLPFDERQNPGDSPVNYVSPRETLTDSTEFELHQLASHDDDLIDCFVHLPTTENIPNVLDYRTIAQAQTGDARLQTLRNQHPAKFSQNLLAPNTQVWCYTAEPNKPWRIYLPDAILLRAIQWYHFALSHIGQSRLTDTMSLIYYNPKLRSTVEAALSKCKPCQEYKNVQRGHGELAPREAALLPWSDIAVDLIGPWTLQVSNQKVTFNALTIIDLVTNLVELVRLDNKTATMLQSLTHG